MFIYCGNSDEIKKKLQKEISIEEELIYTADSISIFNNNPDRSRIVEDSKGLLIFFEGDILNVKKNSVLSLFESPTPIFVKGLEGYFSLFIWDKINKKVLIINDKLGLHPLYYTFINQNELLVSTSLQDYTHISGLSLNIDAVALEQYARFNYILGERTFIENVFRFKPGTAMLWDNKNTTKENYWDVSQLFSNANGSISERAFLKEFPEKMLEVISEWIVGKKKVGILLSGGYDSRAILACLYKIGIQGYAYTWDNPAIKETTITQRLADATGFKLRFLPFYPEEKDTEKLIYEVEELTDFSFPLFHIGRYHAMKQISDSVDIVFSGQGELIRITPVPNDYISEATLSHIYNNKPTDIIEHFFQIQNLPYDIFQEFDYWHLSPTEKLTCFLLHNAYRDDYGMLRYGESKIVPVAMPFFDGRVIELLLKSPYSIARLKSWKRNIPFILKTRTIYYEIVKQMAPHLLDIPLDRGYPQKFDNCYLNSILTGVWSLKNAFNFKKKEIPPWWKYTYNLLSQSKTLNREFYNKQRLKDSLNRFPHWSPEESYELEKAARFELWYRHFIEHN